MTKFNQTTNTNSYKGIIILLLSTLLLFILTGCQKQYGDIISTSLTMPEFDKISIDGATNVTVNYGTSQKIVVTGNQYIIHNRLKNSVSNYDLILNEKDGLYDDYELSYVITIPKIKRATIDGSGNFMINDFDQTDPLELLINGSGNISFDKFPNTESIFVEINGSGSVNGLSNIDTIALLDVEIDGSGSFNAFDLHSQSCNVSIDGSGNTNIFVRNNLDASISGSGSINYKGHPIINSNITGSGSINDRN